MDRQSFIEHAAYERSHWWFQARREIVRSLLERLAQPMPVNASGDIQKLPNVFELGCGTGATVAALSGRYRIAGADISRHAIEFAKQNYPHCELLAYDELDEVADKIRDADFVLLLDVLEHISDDFDFLSRLIALMRPGSHLLLSVPHDPRLWSVHDEALFHYRRYDVARLRSTWDGLPVVETLFTGMNYRLAPLIRVARRIERIRRRGRAAKAKSNLTPVNPLLNKILFRIFSGEATHFTRLLQTHCTNPRYTTSAISLLAVLQRTEGLGTVRFKPAELADQHRPEWFDLGCDESLAMTQ